MNYSKLLLGLYGVLFAGITLWSASFFVQMQRDLTTLRLQEEANQRRLEAATARLRDQQAYLGRLQNDPALLERIIRQKLGYARTQEFVFRFEDPGK